MQNLVYFDETFIKRCSKMLNYQNANTGSENDGLHPTSLHITNENIIKVRL